MNNRNNFFQAQEVSKNFGGLQALDRVSFGVEEDQIFSIIGPNGAGKTTLFNTISGILPCSTGKILLRDLPLHEMSPCSIAKAGVARTFQNIRLFPNMTVLENVLLGCEAKTVRGFLLTGFSLPAVKRMEKENKERALHWLELLKLADYTDQHASSLPYGLQKRLEIARALGTEPILLLLDEPAAGLNDVEIGVLQKTIEMICETLKLTIFLIDHNANLIMSLSDVIMVLDFGKVLTMGTASEVRHDPRVIAAYLGK